MLKDHRVEEKQSFKRLSVYISIKHRNMQCIKKLFTPFNFFAQIAFLVGSSIHFICRRYFYPYFFPAVKRNKKIFYFILLYQFWGYRDKKNVLKLRKMLCLGSNKRSISLLSPPDHTHTKKNLSPDISPGSIFEFLRYYFIFAILKL